MKQAGSEPALVVYDGACIFCQNYVRLLRLQQSVGPVELLDARSEDPRIAEFQAKGYDLDEGMLFIRNGRIYHGHDAVNALALLSSSSGFFNRLNSLLLSRRSIAKFTYPFLKAGRRITLWVRGRPLIAQDLLSGDAQ